MAQNNKNKKTDETWQNAFRIKIDLKKIKTKYKIVFILIFCIIAIFVIIDSFVSDCELRKIRINDNFRGVIVQKDSFRVPYITIKLYNGILSTESVWKNDFDICSIGDSIIKKKGDKRCLIVKKDTSFYIKYVVDEEDDNCKCLDKYFCDTCKTPEKYIEK